MTNGTKKLVILLMLIGLLQFSYPGFGKETPKAIDRDAILKTGPQWHENYVNFQVDDGMLETLRVKIGENLEVVVYLGTWCDDSKKNVPAFIKLVDKVLSQNLTVKYYNVKRKASKDVKYYVEDLKVERVPTFIFYRDGEELGRIVENPQTTLIEDFIEIVF